MTAVDERDMTRYFEELEPPEGVKVELLRGVIVMMASPDIVHNLIVADVQDQIPRSRWSRLQTQDVDIPTEPSEPVPDLVIVARDLLPDSGRLLPSALVTMVVEVVSKSSVHQDYEVKRSIYAAGKVPAYLIVDPIMAQCVLLTKPEGVGEDANYLTQQVVKFGDPVALESVGVELDTSDFGTLPGIRPHRYP
ncbi:MULTISPECIES: Uma2 family endonuclease [unclassified Streptomyces]|uniref:Uma2 family endonuclease n=1 Tax=unclassified Streptomyces TaxID=2593676 RepID=UPI002E77E963|nr:MULTISPECIES: Uma2 family endonuclease [unclassified Streptomyces]MEE1766141.1 Uma2 family endonuclease [Streptomyces sp. SP18BB07]MEE1834761.1 Uma2 family endonuclease [Streptomyces sp. SP17KL33]